MQTKKSKMKCLYLTQQTIVKNDGASEKAVAQNEAINNLGIESKLAHVVKSSSGWELHVGGAVVANVERYKSLYQGLIEYIAVNQIRYIYIRYCVNAGAAFNRFLGMLARQGVTIFMEIPTYPYDGELKCTSVRRTIKKCVEWFFRNRWKGKVYRIVTSSTASEIFGIPTINISNAPAHVLPIKKPLSIDGRINMIAVANLAFWHGYDRLIRGLATYYQSKPIMKVYLTIAGVGNLSVYNELKDLAASLKLGDYVEFIGSRSNTELDPFFENAHLAVGCLGCHRKNIVEVKSLKNVEYAMRGIPMVYSEDNTDFDYMPYVFKVPAEDSDIDVKSLCDFVSGLQMTPSEIHETVRSFTWENQMRKVFDSCSERR